MRIFTTILLFIVFSMMYVGETLHNEDVEKDILNYTNQIQWNQSVNLSLSLVNNTHATKIIESGFDFVGITLFESAKWSINFGYENADEYNFHFFFNLIKWYLFVMIFVLIFPILLPAAAFIFLIGSGAYWLFKKVRNSKCLKNSKTN